jgi:hypothetical protein
MLPAIAGPYGLSASRSAAHLSRLRHAAAAAMPYEDVTRVVLDPKLTIADGSGRSDLVAGNLEAYARDWTDMLSRTRRDHLEFGGVAAVVRMPCPTSEDFLAARAPSPRAWNKLKIPLRDNGSDGLPANWKRFGGTSRVDDLVCLNLVRTVAGICDRRCDRDSVLAVFASGETLVVLIDTRDRLFACIRPERYGGTRAMIGIIGRDLDTLREIADTVAASGGKEHSC